MKASDATADADAQRLSKQGLERLEEIIWRKRLSATTLRGIGEESSAKSCDRDAELLEMLLDWHRPVEGTPIEVIARRYAHAIACMRLVTTQKAEAPISLELPEGFEGANDLDLNRTAVFEVLRMIGSDDPEAWASLLVLLLALRGDRFLEVCDGRL